MPVTKLSAVENNWKETQLILLFSSMGREQIIRFPQDGESIASLVRVQVLRIIEKEAVPVTLPSPESNQFSPN